MAINFFTKWVEAMPTVKSNGKTATFFVFNQIIARFGFPSEIVTDHGRNFQNEMMIELLSKMGFNYPQENGQVEAVNNSLKTILKKNCQLEQFQLAHHVISLTLGILNLD
jgi:hypothetical protein